MPVNPNLEDTNQSNKKISLSYNKKKVTCLDIEDNRQPKRKSPEKTDYKENNSLKRPSSKIYSNTLNAAKKLKLVDKDQLKSGKIMSTFFNLDKTYLQYHLLI